MITLNMLTNMAANTLSTPSTPAPAAPVVSTTTQASTVTSEIPPSPASGRGAATQHTGVTGAGGGGAAGQSDGKGGLREVTAVDPLEDKDYVIFGDQTKYPALGPDGKPGDLTGANPLDDAFYKWLVYYGVPADDQNAFKWIYAASDLSKHRNNDIARLIHGGVEGDYWTERWVESEALKAKAAHETAFQHYAHLWAQDWIDAFKQGRTSSNPPPAQTPPQQTPPHPLPVTTPPSTSSSTKTVAIVAAAMALAYLLFGG